MVAGDNKQIKQTLTGQLLDYVRQRKQAGLDEFIAGHPGRAQTIYTLADRLAKTGFLKKIKLRDGRRLKSFFRLTAEGHQKVTPPVEKSKPAWDGQWRLLIFDIPEDEKNTREYLRSELKQRGFYMLQLSVWLTPYPVEPDLQDLITEIGARDYVRYLVVREISSERDILRFFSL